MANVLSQLGLTATPEADFQSALTVEGAGQADGSSIAAAAETQEYTELGLGGWGTSSPMFIYQSPSLDSATGLAQGTVVVDGQSTTYWNSVGLAAGTSTVEAGYSNTEYLTTLGLSGVSQSYPLLDQATSDTGTGLAFGTSTAEASADVPIVEDYGSDRASIGSLAGSGNATSSQNALVVNASGGLSFSGTATRLKGFTYSAVGGLAFAGIARGIKTRTVNPTGGLLFSGFGGGNPNEIKSFTYNPSGGIQFAGTASVSFFKDFGPGATGKIRDKRRITFSTRSYSRG